MWKEKRQGQRTAGYWKWHRGWWWGREKGRIWWWQQKKDPWDEAKNKARIARDLCQGAANNLEESLTKAKGANRLSKGHKTDAEDLLVESANVIDKLKAFLVKRPANMTLQQAKDMTIHASTVTKNLKGHKKDLDLLSSKALSRCSSKWWRTGKKRRHAGPSPKGFLEPWQKVPCRLSWIVRLKRLRAMVKRVSYQILA